MDVQHGVYITHHIILLQRDQLKKLWRKWHSAAESTGGKKGKKTLSGIGSSLKA